MFSAFRSRLTFANVTSVTALVFAMAGGAYALSGIPDRGGVYHGCVDAKTGVLRVVKTARACRKAKTVRRGGRRVRIPGESAIAWNQQGRQGVPGTPGSQGIQGPKGDPGPTFFTFADPGSESIQLGSAEKVVASTASTTSGVGGPIDIPPGGRFASISAAKVETTGTGVYDCAVQSSFNDAGYSDIDRVTGVSAATLRFAAPDALFLPPDTVTRRVHYQIICRGDPTRTVTRAELSVILGYRGL